MAGARAHCCKLASLPVQATPSHAMGPLPSPKTALGTAKPRLASFSCKGSAQPQKADQEASRRGGSHAACPWGTTCKFYSVVAQGTQLVALISSWLAPHLTAHHLRSCI